MRESGIERSSCIVLFVKDVKNTLMHHQIRFKEIEGHNVEEHEERFNIVRKLSGIPKQKEGFQFRDGRKMIDESEAAKKE